LRLKEATCRRGRKDQASLRGGEAWGIWCGGCKRDQRPEQDTGLRSELGGWHTPVIPVLGLRQEDRELEAGLNYTAQFCLKKRKQLGGGQLTPIIPATQEAEIRRMVV
jgi:hypothetical protein